MNVLKLGWPCLVVGLVVYGRTTTHVHAHGLTVGSQIICPTNTLVQKESEGAMAPRSQRTSVKIFSLNVAAPRDIPAISPTSAWKRGHPLSLRDLRVHH